MAEIDKSLPNVKQTLKVPSQQQQMETQAEAQASLVRSAVSAGSAGVSPSAVADDCARLARFLPHARSVRLGTSIRW